MTRRYLLITPCRDEAAYLQSTLDSVAAQSEAPARWVVVDDGSTDATPEILTEASRRLPFLHVVRREDRGERAVGPGVVEAFYAGLETVDLACFDFVCKLDGDLEIPPGYFARLMDLFEADPYLGTCSGKLFLRRGGRLVPERCGDENSVGPSKFYRVECFQDIGGFVSQVSWDGIDGHMCRRRGWIARSCDEEALRLIHLRRMGSSQKSFWTGRMRWGMGKYYMGSSLSYVAAVSFYRMFERPFLISGLGILLGYLRAAARGVSRFEDRGHRAELRRFERDVLLFGRKRALRRREQQIRQTFERTRASEPAAGNTGAAAHPAEDAA